MRTTVGQLMLNDAALWLTKQALDKVALSTKQVQRMLRALKGKAAPDVPGLRELVAGVASGKSVGHATLHNARHTLREHLLFGSRPPQDTMRNYKSTARGLLSRYRGDDFREARRFARMPANPILEGQRRATAPRSIPWPVQTGTEPLVSGGKIHPLLKGSPLDFPPAIRSLAEQRITFDPSTLWRGSNLHRAFGTKPGERIWASLQPHGAARYVGRSARQISGEPITTSDGLLLKLRAAGWPDRYPGQEDASEFVLTQLAPKQLLANIGRSYRDLGGHLRELPKESLQKWLKTVGYEV